MDKIDFTKDAPKCENLDDANALIGVLWQIARRVDELEAEVADLKDKLAVNSRTSSKPPSSDGPDVSRESNSKKKRSGRNRGGQPGHKGHRRDTVDESEVDTIIRTQPEGPCPSCGGELEVHDKPRARHQVFDIPEPHYLVAEYQRYSATCRCCNKRQEAAFPDDMPPNQMGINLMSLVGVLTVQHHQSVGLIQRFLKDQFNLHFSTGAISEAQGKVSSMVTPVCEAVRDTLQQDVSKLHIDETTHKRERERRWLWAITSDVGAYFLVHPSRGKGVAKKLLTETPTATVISDQYAVYHWLPQEQHQLCWAHQLRHFERMAKRPYSAGKLGQRFLLLGNAVFRTRHRYDKKQLHEQQYQRRIQRLRTSFQRLLDQGIAHHHKRTRNKCIELKKHEPCLWTFLRDDEVPLTNNEAERSLRGYVIWRKLSFATQSHRGDLCRARLCTLMETCRRQGRSLFHYFKTVIAHNRRGRPPPLLLKPAQVGLEHYGVYAEA